MTAQHSGGLARTNALRREEAGPAQSPRVFEYALLLESALSNLTTSPLKPSVNAYSTAESIMGKVEHGTAITFIFRGSISQ